MEIIGAPVTIMMGRGLYRMFSIDRDVFRPLFTFSVLLDQFWCLCL